MRNELTLRMLAEGDMCVSKHVRLNVQDISDKGLFMRSSKREKNWYVAMSPQTLEMLHDFIYNVRQNSQKKRVLTGDYGRMTTSMIRKDVKEIGKMADLWDLHQRALRHFCATRRLKTGVDIRKIQVRPGHASIQSTHEYTHLLTNDVQVEIYTFYAKEGESHFFGVGR